MRFKNETELRKYHMDRIEKILGNYGPNPENHPGFLHLEHMKAAHEESDDILRILDESKLQR
jgi:hypothetical protein